MTATLRHQWPTVCESFRSVQDCEDMLSCGQTGQLLSSSLPSYLSYRLGKKGEGIGDLFFLRHAWINVDLPWELSFIHQLFYESKFLHKSEPIQGCGVISLEFNSFTCSKFLLVEKRSKSVGIVNKGQIMGPRMGSHYQCKEQTDAGKIWQAQCCSVKFIILLSVKLTLLVHILIVFYFVTS